MQGIQSFSFKPFLKRLAITTQGFNSFPEVFDQTFLKRVVTMLFRGVFAQAFSKKA
jgi:hypothetical protein